MGSKQITYIEINGRRYDAATGVLLSSAGGSAARRIDDIKPASKAASHVTKPKVTTSHVQEAAASKPAAQPRMMDDIRRVPAHHAKARTTQHSKTLKRSVVSKPAPGLKRQVHAQTHTGLAVRTPNVAIVPKWAVAQVDPQRLKRAEHTAKSKLIQRFAPVQADISIRSAAVAIPATTLLSLPTAKPAAVVSTEPRYMDIFQRALQHADAHKQSPVSIPKKQAKKARKQAKAAHRAATRTRRPHHIASTVMASLAFLLLAGFITYQNRANITLRYADAKAGFHATLPRYKPSGFAVGKFNYNAGFVGYTLHNETSGKSFSVAQRTSDWDSQTLLENFVANKGSSYQTLQSAGRTIYVYGNNNAAWVNGGVWYQLNTNGNLSTSEIVNVATSM